MLSMHNFRYSRLFQEGIRMENVRSGAIYGWLSGIMADIVMCWVLSNKNQ